MITSIPTLRFQKAELNARLACYIYIQSFRQRHAGALVIGDGQDAPICNSRTSKATCLSSENRHSVV